MQSDTFLPSTDSEDENSDYESDSSGDLPKNNNIGVLYDFPKEAVQGERFIDQSSQEKYVGIRNELFSRDIETIRLCFHTNYRLVDGTIAYKKEIDLILKRFKIEGIVKNEMKDYVNKMLNQSMIEQEGMWKAHQKHEVEKLFSRFFSTLQKFWRKEYSSFWYFSFIALF